MAGEVGAISREQAGDALADPLQAVGQLQLDRIRLAPCCAQDRNPQLQSR